MKKNDLAGAVVFLVIGILTTVLSLRLELGTFQNAGTGMFPLIMGIIFTVLSLIYLLKLIIAGKKAGSDSLSGDPKSGSPEPSAGKEEKKFKFRFSGPMKQLLLTLGALAFAALFLDKLGFLLTSFIVEIVLLKALKMKSWIAVILTSLAVSALSYVLFVMVLHIILPKGFLGI